MRRPVIPAATVGSNRMLAHTTSTRRAVAGAVRIRLKTALTGEDYVGSVVLRDRGDPSLAQQGLRPSPARHLTYAGRRVILAVRQALLDDLIHVQPLHRCRHLVIEVLGPVAGLEPCSTKGKDASRRSRVNSRFRSGRCSMHPVKWYWVTSSAASVR